jgi:hypothetical protein
MSLPKNLSRNKILVQFQGKIAYLTRPLIGIQAKLRHYSIATK